jgi:hypothetical protein
VAAKHGLVGLTEVAALVNDDCGRAGEAVTGGVVALDGGWTAQ